MVRINVSKTAIINLQKTELESDKSIVDLDLSGDRVLDSMFLFSVLCSGKLLGSIPCRSSRESPFLLLSLALGLREHLSETPSHCSPACPPSNIACSANVLPLTKDHKGRESVLRTSLPILLSNSASVGKPTSSNKPSSTTYMPTQIPPADPVRVLSQPCCVSNKVLKLLFCLCNFCPCSVC
ncbi:hypothetical protein ILYODFUR_007143 [Ilyodon furcidens]|uniref:Uncharacterized protein n=1 Tax=Ilyodon furcidens TaxID=33524 RepID=A0ABV0UTE3_9TELE